MSETQPASRPGSPAPDETETQPGGLGSVDAPALPVRPRAGGVGALSAPSGGNRDLPEGATSDSSPVRGGLLSTVDAEWIRATVWTQAMRKTYAEVPGFYTMCACQDGLTHWCQIGNCDRCHRAEPLVSSATSVLKPGGTHPAFFRERFQHKTPSATGNWREQQALVWLGDRVCRWICPHACHTAPPRPAQLDLFEVA